MNSPKKRPIAPPVYRAQPTPKVLQTKTAVARQPSLNQSLRKPVAPPVYRPEHKKVVQPKTISRPPGATIQCVRGITPGTHVGVTAGGSTWYGEVFRVRDDDSYEIRVGGTDTTTVVGQASVTLHPSRAHIGNAGAVYVDMGRFVRSHRLMRTDGLYNCIAVVAHHENSGYAAFTHYNTGNCFKIDEDRDDDSEHDRLVINIPALNQLRTDLLQTLGRHAGVDFYVVLGVSWKDKPTDDADQRRMKQELIDGLNAVLHPRSMFTGGSRTADWDPTFPSLM